MVSKSLTRYWCKQKLKSLIARLTGKARSKPITSHDFGANEADFERFARAECGCLHDLFVAHLGNSIDKWFHYISVYERYFEEAARAFGPGIRMLEIGVFKGGSLQLWRKYFGPQATIFGIDIDPACKGRGGAENQVRIGSQADPAFLEAVVAEMGGIDVVLDDGSHIGAHQRASFFTLFPHLSEGGLYLIEDLHSAYWPGYFKGGFGKPDTGIEFLKELTDDMHAWYHHEQPGFDGAKEQIGYIHTYDSIAVIKKQTRSRPLRREFG